MSLRSEALPEIPNPSRARRRTRQLRAVTGGQPPSETPAWRGRQESQQPQETPVQHRLARVRVLVVDDDEHSADYFTMALRTVGAAVTTVTGAAEALRAVEDTHPDVVLSDIAMPGRDGYWLVRAIREHADAKVREIPVVATTAHGHDHSRRRALAAGFVDHLPKPVEPELLWAAIARAAGR